MNVLYGKGHTLIGAPIRSVHLHCTSHTDSLRHILCSFVFSSSHSGLLLPPEILSENLQTA